MNTRLTLLLILLLSPFTIWAQSAHPGSPGEDYAALLGYLADSRIDGQALTGSRGAVAANLAAGDGNTQANLRAFSVGAYAQTDVRALQIQRNNQLEGPSNASATIGDEALQGASGLVSINQASGSGNAELNIVSAALATQGIREASDETLALPIYSASAGEQSPANSSASKSGVRNVAVESTALQGFEGVLQLNQIAGSANATGNQLSISVQAVP